MENLWSDEESKNYITDLEMRVYTSNLLGRSDELVLHGGGNTSVKTVVDGEDILLVKGSGWDLVSIKAEGFAPVKMKTLLEMAELKELSDSDMVSGQKAAMIDRSAPNPSVEAILHAIIPFKVVDHTHADAIVTMSNSMTGKENIKNTFPNFLIVPYIMPGFILASKINEMLKDLDWNTCEGIILHNHGIFTFDDDAKKSYDKMIEAVSKAEIFLEENAEVDIEVKKPKDFNVESLRKISDFMKVNRSPLAVHYASQPNLSQFATRGVLTPEHIIRTKRIPMILEDTDVDSALEIFKIEYENYFRQFRKKEIMLEAKPKYAVIKDFGIVSFGSSQKEVDVINDIVTHTMQSVLEADKLGGYKSISHKDSFEMEYWELEQAKLKK
ncbi:MAG: rhamnose utilization protein RhaD (predicted bifunctional aldolase and dehydrogenase) [Sulfurimonas sp.]|jgi:rhamnose utilization protein RhaD (predicted bifunctional aldolase and dehydrogenase)|uniref:class II aldolase/adducin family protein n=1 Tax=Sulfurimonas sp. TaxID=2022749 RepID=UPI0039E2DFD4